MSTEVYYWPDNSWCYEDELSMMSHKSDDCAVVEINDESYEEIDAMVIYLNGQPSLQRRLT